MADGIQLKNDGFESGKGWVFDKKSLLRQSIHTVIPDVSLRAGLNLSMARLLYADSPVHMRLTGSRSTTMSRHQYALPH